MQFWLKEWRPGPDGPFSPHSSGSDFARKPSNRGAGFPKSVLSHIYFR